MPPLNFFRIKQGITDPDDIIVERDSKAVHHEPVMLNGKHVADFYWKRTQSKRPPWVAYIEPYVDLEGETMATASLAGVILIKAGPHLFAVLFGYG